MTSKRVALSQQYLAALRTHLKQPPRAESRPAASLGAQAMTDGLDTLDVARIHERALIELLPPEGGSAAIRNGIVKRAGSFFAQAIMPIERTHRAAVETNVRLNELNKTLNRHTGQLAATSLRLEKEIGRRKAVEASLKTSRLHYSKLLAQSQGMQEQLRHLAHQIILTQEAERKEISRELHDQIAQTLAGINVHLAALKLEASASTKGLASKIVRTQRLVEKSVGIVHRFARELRPTVLDDLGLVAALTTYLKDYTKRTHIPVHLAASSGTERLSPDERIVLFRVAQAALANVAQHAKASAVSIVIRKEKSDIGMEIHDNGKSFQVERVLFAKRHRRLGVLGMRERLEMVGGKFEITSASGMGTTISVSIPMGRSAKS